MLGVETGNEANTHLNCRAQRGQYSRPMGSESQLAFIYIYSYISIAVGHVLSQGATARVQNGVSGSYGDAVFELVEHEESESWISLAHSFTKEGLLQLPG